MKIADKIEMIKLSMNVMGRERIVYPTLIWDDDNVILIDTGIPSNLETIKKQTEIFSHFLSFNNENENSIDHGFDYVHLFGYNVDLVLREFGLIEIDALSESSNCFHSDIAGWIQFLEDDIANFIFVKGTFADYNELYFEAGARARQQFYFAGLHHGRCQVYRIFYTQQHERFFKALRAFATNPFLPADVRDLAVQLGRDLQENVHVVLRIILERLVLEYFKAQNQPDGNIPVILSKEYRHQNLYRIFEKERIQHDQVFEELKTTIRKYLNIDDKW